MTGVGGGVGQAVLKSLQDSSYECVAYDSSPLAAGLYLAKDSWLGLAASQPGYIEDVLAAVLKFDCKYVIPGHDVELIPLVKARSLFEKYGVTVVTSDVPLIELADDKYKTANSLKLHGFDTPETWTLDEFIWQGEPVVMKPKKGGARSKNTYIANNEDEFHQYLGLVDRENTVVQEYCTGDEFTCGTLTFDGTFQGSISMKRELRCGDTYKAFSLKNDDIMNTLDRVCGVLQPIGPCNFQLKLDGNRVRIFEINARFSGTTFLRKLCGFDEVIYTLNYLSGRPLPNLKWKEQTMLRLWTEVSIQNTEMKFKQ